MKFANNKKKVVGRKRTLRVRKDLTGTAQRPRMCVVKTTKHLYVQLIDDINSVTLASASTLEKDVRGTKTRGRSVASGRVIGERIAARSLEKGIKCVIFDRGPFKYHGILAAVAESARQQGLEF